jgi:hypothetical protein
LQAQCGLARKPPIVLHTQVCGRPESRPVSSKNPTHPVGCYFPANFIPQSHSICTRLKRAVLLTLLLSGLGAEARPALIGIDSQPLFESVILPIETDFDLSAPYLSQNLWDQNVWDKDPPLRLIIVTDFEEESPDEFDPGEFVAQPVRESPASILLLGLGLVGIVSLWRTHIVLRRKRPIRRRHPRGRPLTVLQ